MCAPQILGYCAGGKLALNVASDHRIRGILSRLILVDPSFLLEDEPHLPADLPRSDFIEWLRVNSSIPEQVFKDSRLFSILEATLRADFQLSDQPLEPWETQVPRSARVDIVLSEQWHGSKDQFAERAALMRWRQRTHLVHASASDLPLRPAVWSHIIRQ
jgi:surfactin synthase thioesterase subunit